MSYFGCITPVCAGADFSRAKNRNLLLVLTWDPTVKIKGSPGEMESWPGKGRWEGESSGGSTLSGIPTVQEVERADADLQLWPQRCYLTGQGSPWVLKATEVPRRCGNKVGPFLQTTLPFNRSERGTAS